MIHLTLRRFFRFAILPLLGCALTSLSSGCAAFGTLQVEPVATSVEPPANVALYLEVTNAGEPVEGLEQKNFSVYENDQKVPDDQARLQLLPRADVASHHVLLLVDMSAPKVDAAQMAEAVGGFVEKVRKNQAVTVYAFDGAPQPALIGQYSVAPQGAVADLSKLAAFQPRDSSRDLGNAIQGAVKELGARLMQSKKPVRVGAIVVFTHGPDLAGRVPQERWSELLDQHEYDVFALVPADQRELGETISDSDVLLNEAPDTPGIVLERAAQVVRDAYSKYYLVAYCSPARAGKRRLTLAVNYVTLEGNERRGDIELDFGASGFGSGCDPSMQPSFATSAIGSLAADSSSKTRTTASAASGSKRPSGAAAPGSSSQDAYQR